MPIPICFRLFTHEMRLAFSLAIESAGNSIAARMAMIAITTSNSIKVKALFDRGVILMGLGIWEPSERNSRLHTLAIMPDLAVQCKRHIRFTKDARVSLNVINNLSESHTTNVVFKWTIQRNPCCEAFATGDIPGR